MFICEKHKAEQAAEKVRVTAISQLLAVFVAPEVLVVGKDMGFIGELFQDFCSSRNIVLQTVMRPPPPLFFGGPND